MNTLLHADGIHVSFKKENQKSLFGRERQQVCLLYTSDAADD